MLGEMLGLLTWLGLSIELRMCMRGGVVGVRGSRELKEMGGGEEEGEIRILNHYLRVLRNRLDGMNRLSRDKWLFKALNQ